MRVLTTVVAAAMISAAVAVIAAAMSAVAAAMIPSTVSAIATMILTAMPLITATAVHAMVKMTMIKAATIGCLVEITTTTMILLNIRVPACTEISVWPRAVIIHKYVVKVGYIVIVKTKWYADGEIPRRTIVIKITASYRIIIAIHFGNVVVTCTVCVRCRCPNRWSAYMY